VLVALAVNELVIEPLILIVLAIYNITVGLGACAGSKL